MKADLTDFELPPLPSEADFPNDIGDIDEDTDISPEKESIDIDTKNIPITDMENNPVDAPPPEDYKSANRRIRISKEKYVYNVRRRRNKLDEFYEQRKKEHELALKGKKDALIFCCCFCALAVTYAAACSDFIAAAAAAAEIVFAVLLAKGSSISRMILFILLPVNSVIGTMSFFGLFNTFVQFMNDLFKKPVIHDPFTKWAYLAMAVLSAAAFIYLLKSREIDKYCSDPENLIDEILTSKPIKKRRFF